MTYTPVTSFRRTLRAADLASREGPEKAALVPAISKWDVLKELGTARNAFGLSDRDITVLQALLSFHKGSDLDIRADQLIVFPSNKKICERLSGMPCSTMRRHLGKLVDAGLVVRRDSPNGKRYVRTRGESRVAYGFDLTPLVQRFVEICDAAMEIRETHERVQALRETVSLMRRDLAGLAELGATEQPSEGLWDALNDLASLSARTLRRKLDEAALEALRAELETALAKARDAWSAIANSEEMSTSDAQIEQHQYTNNLEESESSTVKIDSSAINSDVGNAQKYNRETDPSISISDVEDVFSEMQIYFGRPVRSWDEFEEAADIVRPMMGLSSEVWGLAKDRIGAQEAAIVLGVMLRNYGSYRSPGAYLRTLANRASEGRFSCSRFLAGSRRLAA